jgi:hypothetical protein
MVRGVRHRQTTNMSMRRIWLTFSAFAVLLLGADWCYLQWRERSLEPLSEPIDLARTGSYTFEAHGFHASTYHPEFRLQLPFKTDIDNWFPDDRYQQLWDGDPPSVKITVVDAEGRRVFHDESALTRADGWTVTGAIGMSEVELYKSTGYSGEMFGTYVVTLDVVRGSRRAASYQPTFEVATMKTYALLGPALLFLILATIIMAIGVALAIVHLFVWRRRKRIAHAAA